MGHPVYDWHWEQIKLESDIFSYLLIPIRTVVEVVSVVNKDLLAHLDVVGGDHAGNDAESRVVEGAELGVGHERVVGLVGQGGRVVGLIPEINNLSLNSKPF